MSDRPSVRPQLAQQPLPPDQVGLLEGMATTRTIRRYTTDPVPAEALRAMLFAATTINYMDRMVMGLLKPTLMHSVAQGGIGMTEVGFANVMSFFTLFYAIGLLFIGRFVDKVGTRIGYMVIMAAWSLSAMGHSLANSVLQFGIARSCLGIGESGNFPAANKTNAEWFPQEERSFSFGIFNSGANVGVILASIIVPLVILHFNWHYAFLVTGFLSSSWILLWFLKFHKPTEHPSLSATELAYINQDPPEKPGPPTPWIKLLGYRQTWAFAIGKFLTDPVWWFYVFWLPDYLGRARGLSLESIGAVGWAPFLAAGLGSIAGGWTSGALVRRGVPAPRARFLVMAVSVVLMSAGASAAMVRGLYPALALISVATFAYSAWAANVLTLPADLLPSGAVGSAVGLSGTAAGAGGTLVTLATGAVVDHFGYRAAFWFPALLPALALLPIAWLVRRPASSCDGAVRIVYERLYGPRHGQRQQRYANLRDRRPGHQFLCRNQDRPY